MGGGIDDVGDENGVEGEEDADKDYQSQIGNDDLQYLSHFDRHVDQLDQGEGEEEETHQDGQSDRNEEECQVPCVVVL